MDKTPLTIEWWVKQLVGVYYNPLYTRNTYKFTKILSQGKYV